MKSTGFKMNRNLKNFLEILGVTPETTTVAITTAQIIFEIRAITGKYQMIDSILADLVEMDAQTQTEAQSVEPVAANDNGGD